VCVNSEYGRILTYNYVYFCSLSTHEFVLFSLFSPEYPPKEKLATAEDKGDRVFIEMYGNMLVREVVQFTTSTIPYTQIYGLKKRKGTLCLLSLHNYSGITCHLLTQLLCTHSGVEPELKMTLQEDTVEVLCVVCVIQFQRISEFEFVLCTVTH
jgi:hypothetical protein